jgi:hypothetical protein
MPIASFFHRHRRVLVLCAATVVLHYWTIDWLAERIGVPADATPPMTVPMTVKAQVRLALPQRTQAVQRQADTAAPVSAPPRRPRAARPAVPPAATAAPGRLLPEPVAEPVPGLAPDSAPDSTPDVLAMPVPVAPAAAPASQQASAVAEPPAVQSPPASAAPASEPAAGRRFRVNLPPPASFELDVLRTDADGTRWTGSADMRWQTDGSRYQVSLAVGISMLVARIDLLQLASEGTIDDAGIAPVKMTEKRRSRSMTATHFDHEGKRITFSASTAAAALLAGAQDKASVPFQLAAIGRGDVNQFGSDIDIQVGEDRGAAVYRFQLVGEEELETKMGRLVTWRLARPPRPGSYSARLDIWLAPALDWYPVQIRNTEANGAVTTQTVTKILRPAQ